MGIFLFFVLIGTSNSLTASGKIHHHTYNPGGGGGACTWVFKVTGMIDFLGFEIFDSGIFLGTKIWQVFFWVA